jgi:hypothetical protein
MLIADAPKTTDWISSLASVSSVLVTLGIAVFITYYASGYRVRVRSWIDKGNIVRVRAFNWGRLDGEVSECRVVVRHRLAGRILRRIARKPKREGRIASVLDAPAQVKAGTTETWYVRVDLDQPHPLPVRRHPFQTLTERQAARSELTLAMVVGLGRRTKYRRLHALSGRFPTLPPSVLGSRPSETQVARAERSMELLDGLTKLRRDAVLSEAELITQRRKILDDLVGAVIRQTRGPRNGTNSTRDFLDIVDVLRALGESRRNGLIPEAEFDEHKARLLALL